ncbi:MULTISPECIES: DUF6894 family protein [Methylobacterium]|uniref:DUF6894 domain-containing protein n=1 Tax=Methylobacterium thuringiense TaxID=1003091 RepID=A0ABQ4TJ24_9HYPH|nr:MULTISPECIES: hypothetical protein [Methylobacterium]TXN21772.1 hypothetical protein FV217_13260 [Methylobacterium sp. WL9]GJE54819.1 hypothetical protein EKPJFOCH_1304 [Methylobacterium thuringiense]
MPRYFFDVNDGAELQDDVGRVLESGAPLRAEAIRTVALLLAAEADNAKDTALVLSVRDANGAIPLKVRMACHVEET